MSSSPASAEVIDVSILIVAYNSAGLIGECIGSIAAGCARHRCEVLLVDNGDGSTEELVARQFPEVRIVPSRGNIGFAGGNNWLAMHARAERYLLLNPDMVVMPGAIDALIEGAQRHKDAAAWGGVTYDPEGNPDAGNAIAVPSLIELASVALGRSLVGSRTPRGFDLDQTVDVLVGGFVMFSKQAWDEAGGLDERYFLYCEEVDLFHRLGAKGYKFWRIPAASARHVAAHGNNLSPMRLMYRSAGTMEFARQHWSLPARLLAILLIWIGALERFVAGKVLGGSRPHLQRLGESYRLVATRPHYWWSGYDPKSGLMVRLSKSSRQ